MTCIKMLLRICVRERVHARVGGRNGAGGAGGSPPPLCCNPVERLSQEEEKFLSDEQRSRLGSEESSAQHQDCLHTAPEPPKQMIEQRAGATGCAHRQQQRLQRRQAAHGGNQRIVREAAAEGGIDAAQRGAAQRQLPQRAASPTHDTYERFSLECLRVSR